MWRCACFALIVALFCFLGPSVAIAEKRVALVIGNSAYTHTGALPNPVNDAADLAVELVKVGFEVIHGANLDKASMDGKIREFTRRLDGADTGLFFYAGHGLQVAGVNYLVPIDAQLTTAAALDVEMVRLDLVQQTMERQSTTNLLFLDACRDNPLARNLARTMGFRSSMVGRGLASTQSGVGTLISYSTQPGNVALDGAGHNSPFAEALIKHLPTPGDDLSTVLINVRRSVMEATNKKQVPWEHSALTGKFYFVDATKTALPPAKGVTEEPPRTTQKTSPSARKVAQSYNFPVGVTGEQIASCLEGGPKKFARGTDYELRKNLLGDFTVEAYIDDKKLLERLSTCSVTK